MLRALAHFSNKTIFLTGAASGIGKALALTFAQKGVRLVLVDVQDDALQATATLCRTMGADVHVALCDVASLAAMRQLKARLPERFLGVDVVIANAGISLITSAEAFDPEQNERIIRINYTGTVNAVSLFLPEMVARRAGQVAAVSSLAGYRGLPGSACYGASKAAQSIFLEGLRVDLRPHGVKVSCVYPGFVDTPINQPLLDLYKLPHMLTPEEAAKRIVRGLARGHSKIAFPLPSVIMGWFAIRMPNRIYDFCMRINPYRKKPTAVLKQADATAEPKDAKERHVG